MMRFWKFSPGIEETSRESGCQALGGVGGGSMELLGLCCTQECDRGGMKGGNHKTDPVRKALPFVGRGHQCTL